MGRPKKQIRKRDKVFNFMDKAIDLVKNKWRTYVFFWIDTVAKIKFEIIYI